VVLLSDAHGVLAAPNQRPSRREAPGGQVSCTIEGNRLKAIPGVSGPPDLTTARPPHQQRRTDWITAVRAADLPHLHSFANGLELDRAAADAGLTVPYHNGRTEGVNTRTKKITRQMHGRAGFPLLRQRVLLQ
jgi:hypothetical protein